MLLILQLCCVPYFTNVYFPFVLFQAGSFSVNTPLTYDQACSSIGEDTLARSLKRTMVLADSWLVPKRIGTIMSPDNFSMTINPHWVSYPDTYGYNFTGKFVVVENFIKGGRSKVLKYIKFLPFVFLITP